WSLARVLLLERSDPALLWAAATQAILAVSVGLYAWLIAEEAPAHAAAWLGVIAGGLVAVSYSQGRGSSAAKAALLAIGYVLAERALRRAALARRVAWRPLAGQAWRLFRRPLLYAGWSVSAGVIGLALVRNLLILGGGRTRETWAVLGLLLITGLYAASAWLFRRRPALSLRLVWLAAGLLVVPWTLLTRLGWYTWQPYPPLPRHALAWTGLALVELAAGIALARRLGNGRWAQPPQVVAHLLLPFALLWGVADVLASSATVGLGVAFYLLATWVDRHFRPPTARVRGRFLYPAAALVPVWTVYLLARFAPTAPQTTYGLMLLAFTLPMLFLGRWLERRERAYGLPLYLIAYGTAIAGTMLVAHDRPALIGALLFDAVVAFISTWTFREPLWLYPATAALPAALLLALAEANVPASRHGWALIALGGLYQGVAWVFRRGLSASAVGLANRMLALPGRVEMARYGTPFLVAAFALVAMGLPPSGQDRLGAQVGYGAAALLYAVSAAWLRQPILLTPAAGLAVGPYWLVVLDLGIGRADYGLALWPGIGAALLVAYVLDRQPPGGSSDSNRQPPGGSPFPWYNPVQWLQATAERLLNWWALPFYAVAFGGAAVSALLSPAIPPRLPTVLLLAAAIYGLAALRFRLRGWFLLAATSAQLAVLAAIRGSAWWERPERVALAFVPVTIATALIGLAIERRFREGSPLGGGEQALQAGWSRPLYALLVVNLAMGQAISIGASSPESVWITLAHTVLLTLLATAWVSPGLAYLPPLLGVVVLGQELSWLNAPDTTWPWALALLALAYGLVGYLLRYLRQRAIPAGEAAGVLGPPASSRQARTGMLAVLTAGRVWERPLRLGGWLLSGLSLLWMFNVGVNVTGLIVRAIFRQPLLEPAETPRVQMVVAVLAILGLFYLAAALVDGKRWLGYWAIGLLLAAWSLEWLLLWGQREVQWYALPAGIYLLGIGYLEWREGNRGLACWVDRAALLLLLGSAFWQSLGADGWPYALLMGGEGLLVVWWGSTRRLRRFLYAGVIGVTVDVAGQLIDPLLSANRWIVFGAAGLALVALAILVERRLETALALTQEVRQRLEKWE
ncbi:MAG: hypothetical protein L0332_12310, partial [Chloroflexi bacterium]|nr:hypothetical protein [Chloroflexota bacterium]